MLDLLYVGRGWVRSLIWHRRVGYRSFTLVIPYAQPANSVVGHEASYQESVFDRCIKVDLCSISRNFIPQTSFHYTNYLTMAPTQQKAVYITKTGATFGLADVPKPGPGQILVKVVAAAQNPVDCQFTHRVFWEESRLTYILSGKSLGSSLNASQYGAIIGHDFAGTVEEIGLDVPAGVRTVGERVGGFTSRNS